MTILEKLIQTTVPEAEKPIVDLFRSQLNDTAELNTLDEIQESSDIELYRALLMTVNELNNNLVYEPNFTELKDVTNINLLFLGATLKVLTSKGILSARNTLTYQDAGGVTVQDYDKYGRYINYFNILVSSYYRDINFLNVKSNIDACYGEVNSEYLRVSWYQ